MEFKIGQIVISKAGRDKGCAFVICKIEGEYVFLVDGRLRLIDKPKKKKQKHLQPTKMVSSFLAQGILDGDNLKDADFRAAIKEFRAKPDGA